MAKVRVMLADDHKMMREGLRVFVTRQTDMEVIAEAENGKTTVALAQKLQPDVLVMDVSMPDVNGLTATEILHKSHPDIKVLTLTRHRDTGYLQELLRAGARGYVLKQSGAEELVRAIRALASGNSYIDPAITGQAVGVMSQTLAGATRAGTNLSNREEEVLRLVAWGLVSREIAARLGISIKTVESHKANAMSKLGIANRLDIVRYALLRGWLEET
jgi:two-component system, NarL family, response regulator NreC